MKKIILISLFILSSAIGKSSTRLLLTSEANEVEKNFLATEPKKDSTLKISRAQAFAVELNPKELKDAVFAPFVDEITSQVQFVLLTEKGKKIIQVLPKSELAVTGIFAFQKVEAVSFKDINRDGTRDILILTTYFDSRPVQGEGVGGGSMKIGFVFLSKDGRFEINDDCGESDSKDMSTLEKCARKLTQLRSSI